MKAFLVIIYNTLPKSDFSGLSKNQLIFWAIGEGLFLLLIIASFINSFVSPSPTAIATGSLEYRMRREADSILPLHDWCKRHYLSFVFPVLMAFRTGHVSRKERVLVLKNDTEAMPQKTIASVIKSLIQ